MFERFTETARTVVTRARDEARALGHPYIGTEHLLLGLLHPASGSSSAILREAALDRDHVVAEIARLRGERPLPLGRADAEALRTIGIDLDSVVAAVERSFGPGALRQPLAAPARVRRFRLRPFGLRRRRRRRRELRRMGVAGDHIPFMPRSKTVLELSLREAVRLRHNHIGSEHILLGLLREGEGLAALILVEAGLTLDDLRRRTLRALGNAA